MYEKWDLKPLGLLVILSLELHIIKLVSIRKKKSFIKKQNRIFLIILELIYRQAVLHYTEGNTNEANEYIEKYQINP